MAFLRTLDYYETISEDHLNQILEEARDIDGDPEVLARAELRAISKATEYLTSRFKVNRIFAPFKDWSLATTYTWGDRIDFTAPDYSALTVYTNGTLTLYSGNVYEKNATTSGYVAGVLPTNATFFTLRGSQDTYYIPFPVEFDSDEVYELNDKATFNHEVYYRNATGDVPAGTTPDDSNYWTRIKSPEWASEYPVLGQWPNNSTYWVQGDNRNQSIIEAIVHMVINKIHSIINPRNIPGLRRDNYLMTMDWFKVVQKGEIEADLPAKLTEQTGYSIRFGSNAPTNHGY